MPEETPEGLRTMQRFRAKSSERHPEHPNPMVCNLVGSGADRLVQLDRTSVLATADPNPDCASSLQPAITSVARSVPTGKNTASIWVMRAPRSAKAPPCWPATDRGNRRNQCVWRRGLDAMVRARTPGSPSCRDGPSILQGRWVWKLRQPKRPCRPVLASSRSSAIVSNRTGDPLCSKG
jgi:hypothetical protein